MSSWLENVRVRPVHERKVIAGVSAGVITLVIFFVWLWSGPFATSGAAGIGAAPEVASSTPGPFTILTNTLSTFFESAGKDIRDLSKLVGGK